MYDLFYRDTDKQTIENQSKIPTTSVKFKPEKISLDQTLCQQLCSKLNLTNSNQINEILDLLASKAPHILKEQPPMKPSFTHNGYSTTNYH